MVATVSSRDFYISSGVLFSVAILTVIVRTIIRLKRFRRLYSDDGILYFGLATLVAGMTLLWIDIPLARAEQQYATGTEAPPPDFGSVLARDEKIQDAATSLLLATVCSVKFSFLMLFHRIIGRGRRLYTVWWWIVLAIVAASTPILIFSNLISCPYTGSELLTKCVSDSALKRETAALQASTSLDILSDAFIISIPAMILWNVQISTQRKLGLTCILCLSIFMIVCAIVRVSYGTRADGQVDTLWLLLWTAFESSIAVICVSSSAFALIFKSSGSARHDHPGEETHRNRIETQRHSFPSTTNGLSVSCPSHEDWSGASVKGQQSDEEASRGDSTTLASQGKVHEEKRTQSIC